MCSELDQNGTLILTDRILIEWSMNEHRKSLMNGKARYKDGKRLPQAGNIFIVVSQKV